MSKKNFAELTFEERGKLASQVKRLRQDAKFTQGQLAELAGITRQALSNIERGSVPQVENLRRIYEVLGVELQPYEFAQDTQMWLSVLGGILDAMPPELRADAGKAAVDAATGKLAAAANVSGMTHDELSNLDLGKSDVDLAATHDGSTVQDQQHPAYEEESQDTED